MIIESKNSWGADVVIIIDEENDTAVSMLKSTYDEMIAKQGQQSTPMVTDEANPL
jgi:hypothetical protein